MKEGYYILLGLHGKRCVVVGGGSLATRKVEALCRCGADVHIVAPSFCDVITRRTDVTLHQKEYESSDIEGATLAFACTDNSELNKRVAEDCKQARVLCNVVDDPDWCDFTVPAVLKRGPIQIAVGTGGASPYLAGRLRDLIAGWLDRAYEPFARRLAALRPLILERVPQPEQRRAIFQQLAGRESFDRFKREGNNAWCEWISERTQKRISVDEAIKLTSYKKDNLRFPRDSASSAAQKHTSSSAEGKAES